MSTNLDDEKTVRSLPGQEEHYRPYRAICGLAVASLIFGAASILTMADWALGVIPLVGVVLGLLALRRIRHYPDTLMGITAARMGILLSVLLFVVGYSRLAYLHRTQAPPGYQPISYNLLEPTVRGEIIPKTAKDLDKKRVYIKGYMSPGRQQRRITRFVMVRDNGVCGFCAPKPKPCDLVGVELIHGLEVEYTTRVIGVAGEFSVTEKPESGGLLYRIKADFFH
jgi:hypothetical protein